MRALTKLMGVLILPVAVLMTGCGDSSLGQKASFKLDPITQSAKFEVEMTNGLEVSMAGNYLIQNNWGHVYFVSATKSNNARIGIAVDLLAVIGHQIDLPIISSLPNGAPLPVAVTPPLFSIPVHKDNNFNLKALLSLAPDLQMGVLAGIKAFSTKYVLPGFAVCQNFRNADKVAIAAICIYGPNADNTESGGVMIGGSFGNVLPSNVSEVITNVASSQSMTLAATSSRAFKVGARNEMPSLNLSPMASVVENFDKSSYDPKNELFTSKGYKTYRNVEKFLKVKR